MQPNCLHDNSALTQSGHAAGWGSHSPTCDPNLLAVILAVYGFSGEKRADSNLPTHTLELLHKWIKLFVVPAPERQVQVSQTEELRRLKAELRRVTEERDILKKAAAYFAKQSG